jgi:hypothetical protein
MNNALESVKVNVEFDEKSYENLLQRGLELREKADGLSWELGDLAIEASLTFDKNLFKQFAREIGVKVGTLKRYRDVAKAYPDKEVREELRILSWSHFRQVAANPDRVQILRKACDENWSVEKLTKMTSDEPDLIDDGQNVPPRPELNLCLKCRKWYIPDSEDQCKTKGTCEEQ